jgi:hypothetical protein
MKGWNRSKTVSASHVPICYGIVLLSLLLATEAFPSPATQSSRRISGMTKQVVLSTTIVGFTSCGRIITHMSADDTQWEEPFVPEQGGGGNGNKRNNKNPKDDSIGDKFQRWWNSDEGKDDVKTYLISMGVALLLRFTIIEPRFIPSLSMYPTFEVGDQLAVEKVTKRLKPFYRQEVVVFHPPQTFRDIMVDQYGQDASRAKEALIKRIVGIEVRKGETLWFSLFIFASSSNTPHTIRSDVPPFPLGRRGGNQKGETICQWRPAR